MLAPLEPPADCCVVTVGVLQFENAIGPAKSLSTDVNDPDERVWGTNVLMQPLNPAAARSMPPSINSLVSSVPVPAPLASRQTQPPHVMPLAPVFTPNEARAAKLLRGTYCGSPFPGLPFAAGSQTVKSLLAS